MKKTALAMLFLAASLASAKSYPVTLFRTVVLCGTEMQPGEYSLDVDSNKAVLKRGKVAVECNVTVEKADQNYRTTAVRYAERDGKTHIQEFRLGGTDMRLVVN
jgi:hypothetical protein